MNTDPNRAPSGRPYDHPEAFCLMQYESADGTGREVIWNSRDGVTPYLAASLDGVELRHVRWNEDERRPYYRPAIGSRVFVDLTLDAARAYRREYVGRWWEKDLGGGYRMCDMFASPMEAVEKLAKGDYEAGGAPGKQPDLVVVTIEMAAEFVARSEKWMIAAGITGRFA